MATKVKEGRENVNQVLVMATSGALLQAINGITILFEKKKKRQTVISLKLQKLTHISIPPPFNIDHTVLYFHA